MTAQTSRTTAVLPLPRRARGATGVAVVSAAAALAIGMALLLVDARAPLVLAVTVGVTSFVTAVGSWRMLRGAPAGRRFSR